MSITEVILIVSNIVFAGLYIKYLGKYHDRDQLAIMLKGHVAKLNMQIIKLKKQVMEKSECQ